MSKQAGEHRYLVQGYTVSEQQSQDLNPCPNHALPSKNNMVHKHNGLNAAV